MLDGRSRELVKEADSVKLTMFSNGLQGSKVTTRGQTHTLPLASESATSHLKSEPFVEVNDLTTLMSGEPGVLFI